MSIKVIDAYAQLDQVFGPEFRSLPARQVVLVCEDCIDVAQAEDVSVGKASNILYERVGVGNLASYAGCLAAGERRRRIEALVERSKGEILACFATGQIPQSVRSFTDLHDYIDANELGGFCEDGFDKGMTEDEFCDITNRVQGRVDAWLKSGPRHTCELCGEPWWTPRPCQDCAQAIFEATGQAG